MTGFKQGIGVCLRNVMVRWFRYVWRFSYTLFHLASASSAYWSRSRGTLRHCWWRHWRL